MPDQDMKQVWIHDGHVLESRPVDRDCDVYWIDIDRQTEGWRVLLEESLGHVLLDEHVKDADNADHPPFHDSHPDYDILIVPELGVGGESEYIQTQTFCILTSRSGVATFHASESTASGKIIELMKKRPGAAARSPLGLVIRLLTEIVDHHLTIVDWTTADVDSWRERILDPNDRVQDWNRIFDRRGRFRRQRALIEQFDDALLSWRENTDFEFDNRLTGRFNNVVEHLRRVSNHLRELEAEVESLVELHFSVTAHQTNETVRFLTVISAIFMPLTLVAGIFGMNFVNMPELQLKYGYPVALVGMVALALGLAAFFRRKGWF